MKEGLRNFLARLAEDLLRTKPMQQGVPALRDVFERRDALDGALAKVHPDLSDGDTACIFFYEALAHEIRARLTADRISELEGKSFDADDKVVEEISKSLVEFIKSVPRQTLALVPIGSIDAVPQGYFDLGYGFCVLKVPADPSKADDLPKCIRGDAFPHDAPMAQFLPSTTSIPAGAYLGRMSSGIPTFLAGRETFNRSFDDLKVWIGIGRRLYHFSDQEQPSLLLAARPTSIKYAYMYDTERSVRASMPLSLEESGYLSRLKLNIKNGDVVGYRKAFEMTAAPFFDGKDLRPAAAAYQWLVDSLTAMNETNSFLYCCIGLEAALGEENAGEESITTLLAERCAYLLGETNSQRAELRTNFKKIYKIRSKLVHGRERRVPSLIGRSLLEARGLLEQVAFAEWGKVIKQRLKK